MKWTKNSYPRVNVEETFENPEWDARQAEIDIGDEKPRMETVGGHAGVRLAESAGERPCEEDVGELAVVVGQLGCVAAFQIEVEVEVVDTQLGSPVKPIGVRHDSRPGRLFEGRQQQVRE